MLQSLKHPHRGLFQPDILKRLFSVIANLTRPADCTIVLPGNAAGGSRAMHAQSDARVRHWPTAIASQSHSLRIDKRPFPSVMDSQSYLVASLACYIPAKHENSTLKYATSNIGTWIRGHDVTL